MMQPPAPHDAPRRKTKESPGYPPGLSSEAGCVCVIRQQSYARVAVIAGTSTAPAPGTGALQQAPPAPPRSACLYALASGLARDPSCGAPLLDRGSASVSVVCPLSRCGPIDGAANPHLRSITAPAKCLGSAAEGLRRRAGALRVPGYWRGPRQHHIDTRRRRCVTASSLHVGVIPLVLASGGVPAGRHQAERHHADAGDRDPHHGRDPGVAGARPGVRSRRRPARDRCTRRRG